MDDRPCIYQIRINGELGPQWSDWFIGMTVAIEEGQDRNLTTTMTGSVDQAALRGVLNKIWDLNLVLISLYRIDGSV